MDITQTAVTLRDGSMVLLGPITPCDRTCIMDAFSRLSDRSRYSRYHSPVRSLPDDYLDCLIHPDNLNNVVVAAHVEKDGVNQGIGLARYVRLEDEPEVAEFSITIVDSWQGIGLGARLLESLVEHARDNRVSLLRGYVLPTNDPMIKILKGYGAVCQRESDGTLRFDFDPALNKMATLAPA